MGIISVSLHVLKALWNKGLLGTLYFGNKCLATRLQRIMLYRENRHKRGDSSNMKITNIDRQRAEWKRKGWSIPELRGGKQEWFNIVSELVKIIGTNSVADLGITPTLESIDQPYPWRIYAPFLKGVGLVSNRSGILSLSNKGMKFMQSPSKFALASLLHDKYRLV